MSANVGDALLGFCLGSALGLRGECEDSCVPELSAGVVAAFRKGLNETGFIEGRNATVRDPAAQQSPDST